MRFNIRAKLTLALATVAIVSVAIHSFISTRTLATKLQDEIITRLSQDNSQKMETLDRFLFERLSDINILTSPKNIALSGNKLDIRGKIEYLRDMERQRKVYVSMSIYNGDGIRIGDTRGLGIGEDDSSKPFLKEAVKGMIYSDPRPIYSARLGDSVMHFSSPLRDENGIITGVVVTRFPINKINHIIEGRSQAKEKADIPTDLLDRDGLVIFSNHNRGNILKQKLSELQIYRKIVASERNIETIIALHAGVKKLFVAVKEDGHLDYEGKGWILVTSIDTATAFAPVRKLTRKSLFTGSIAVFVFILLAPFMSGTISKPIRMLTDVAADISQDKLDTQIPRKILVSKDEVGNLGQAFQKMIEDVQKSRDELVGEITQRKRAEEVLARHAEELERSNAELAQFAYVASHDLKEPLRMVSSYMQLLQRRYKGKLDSDADEFIDYAVDGATRMQGLINDLLVYSRVGTRSKDLEPTDCEAVLEWAIGNLQVAIEESGAVVTHEALPIVMADDTQLTQLLQNLIGNAIKFHGEDAPIIHISAKRKANEWIFSVRDNGIGIDRAYADRVFLIFQRLHTREEYSGTGIGLAICKKIVDRHGGRIWFDSEPNEGSTFYFAIPAK